MPPFTIRLSAGTPIPLCRTGLVMTLNFYHKIFFMNTSIAWAAGLFEGEGYIGKRKNENSYRLTLSMCDYDVVQRFMEVVGVGSVSEFRPPAYKDHWKTQLRWYVGKKQDVRKVLDMLLPYLGNRRAYKALNALDDIELSNT